MQPGSQPAPFQEHLDPFPPQVDPLYWLLIKGLGRRDSEGERRRDWLQDVTGGSRIGCFCIQNADPHDTPTGPVYHGTYHTIPWYLLCHGNVHARSRPGGLEGARQEASLCRCETGFRACLPG